jgi:hypothetical protein
VVPQGDLGALVIGMNELVINEVKRKEFGKIARGIALSKWNYEIMNSRISTLYRNLLRG